MKYEICSFKAPCNGLLGAGGAICCLSEQEHPGELLLFTISALFESVLLRALHNTQDIQLYVPIGMQDTAIGLSSNTSVTTEN